MKLLSANEAAKILGVSSATVRNWHRANHIQPANARPLLFAKKDVLALKERIRTNRFNRLRKRANKTAADHMPPAEAANPEISAFLGNVGARIIKEGINPAHMVFLAALRHLEAEDEVNLPKRQLHRVDPEKLTWRREPVREVVLGWRKRIESDLHPAAGEDLDRFLDWEESEDKLGILHQGLSPVGKKACTGAYFTPGDIIDDSLGDFGEKPGTFLDPCCGTGRYMLRAAARFGIDPAKLYGFDSDPVAVDIARLNLLTSHRDLDFVPMVRCLDSLNDLANGEDGCDTNRLLGAVDAIATNPPWGSCKNRIRHKNLAAIIKSGESFSLFLAKSLHLLRPGGRLSFILPESMLKIKAHADIRRLLLKETTISKIVLLGRVFSGVYTSIMRLDLIKSPAPKDWMLTIVRNGSAHRAAQRRFAANNGHSFDVAVTPDDEHILSKIYSVPHQTLHGQAEWALGIVTGDNGRNVLATRLPDTEPVLRGRDVFKFAPRRPRCFIRFKPATFQQVAPERFFRAPEKLIYRFVSDKLVFAYDNHGYLTLNSANILIPRLPGMSIKCTLAFLNSLVFQYIFVKRFRTRKILRGDLETLPFPIIDQDSMAAIDRQVDKCMTGEYRQADELDKMVFKAFGLTRSDAKAMEDGLAVEAEMVIL